MAQSGLTEEASDCSIKDSSVVFFKSVGTGTNIELVTR